MISAFSADQPAGSRATILLAEDEILVRLMVADELRAEGYTVVEAANADEALTVLRSNSAVDLLITDVRMPGTLDGLGLARLVRAEYPATKVVIASGHMASSEAAQWVDAFISKPYDFPKLATHIKTLLA